MFVPQQCSRAPTGNSRYVSTVQLWNKTMVPNQRGFSLCGINDHCISKRSCLNRDFILAVPNSSRWRERTVYTTGWRELYFLDTQYSWSIYNSCLMFPRCEHEHRMLLFLSSLWRKTVTSGELLASGESDPVLPVLFPENPLQMNRERSCGLWIVLAACSQPPVLWDKTGPGREG